MVAATLAGSRQHARFRSSVEKERYRGDAGKAPILFQIVSAWFLVLASVGGIISEDLRSWDVDVSRADHAGVGKTFPLRTFPRFSVQV